MSASTKTKAIVINARKYGESDLIVSFVTEDYGLVSGLAKGALKSRKRFAGCFEPFTMVELSCVLKSGVLARIEGADILDAHYGLREDLDRISAASGLVEIASLIEPPEQETAVAFGVIASGLSSMEKSARPLELLAVYMVRYLSTAGFGIHTDTCSECGRAITGGAYYKGGEGLLCAHCGGAACTQLGPGLMAFIRGALTVDEDKASRLRLPDSAMREFCRFMAPYLRGVSGREPRAFLFAYATCLS